MKKYVWAIGLIVLVRQGICQDVKQLIKESDVTRMLAAVSSDEMQGRGNFTPGIEKAATYIETQFKKTGLIPLPGNVGYKQTFTMIKTVPSAETVIINGDTIPEEKVIVASPGTFYWINSVGVKIIRLGSAKSFPEEYLSLIRKNENALILVDRQHENIFRHLRQNLSKMSYKFKQRHFSAQVFVLTESPGVHSITVKYIANSESLPLSNIVGVLPGKTKRNEYVIFSGHYDHLGIIRTVGMDSIANGADDNASGVTGVIALADYYKKLGTNERSIIFVAFVAEEIGDFGSEYFAKMIDPAKVMAMFNFIMIGKQSKFGSNAAFITGFNRSDLGLILQRNVRGSGFAFYPDPYTKFDLFYRSDNASLARLGVPAHAISSDPVDMDKYYHTVKDEINTLDTRNLTAIIQAVAIGSKTIVSGKDTPTRIEKKQ